MKGKRAEKTTKIRAYTKGRPTLGLTSSDIFKAVCDLGRVRVPGGVFFCGLLVSAATRCYAPLAVTLEMLPQKKPLIKSAIL